MAIDVGTLEATLKLVDELSPATADMDAAVAQFEKTLGLAEGAVSEYQAELAKTAQITQQMQEQAEALGLTYNDVAEMVNRQTAALEEQASVKQQYIDFSHEQALAEDKARSAMDETASTGASLANVFKAVLSGSIMDVISAFGKIPASAAVAVSAFKMASGAVLDLAGEAERLSNKALSRGMTTDSVQALNRLAEEAGVSAHAVENAILRMNMASEKGSKAFKNLHLNMSEFRGAAPEKQLQMVAEKIEGMGTASERAAAAQQLFGRGMADQVLPVLSQLANGEMPQMVGLLKDQIQHLKDIDNANDAANSGWKDLRTQFVALLAEFPGIEAGLKAIGNALSTIALFIRDIVIPAVIDLKAKWTDIFAAMDAKQGEHTKHVVQNLTAVQSAIKQGKITQEEAFRLIELGNAKAINARIQGFGTIANGLQSEIAAVKNHADGLEKLNEKYKAGAAASDARVASLQKDADAERKKAEDMRNHIKAIQDVSTATHKLTEDEIKANLKAMRASDAKRIAVIENERQMLAARQKTWDALAQNSFAAEDKAKMDALPKSGALGTASASNYAGMQKAAIDAVLKGGQSLSQVEARLKAVGIEANIVAEIMGQVGVAVEQAGEKSKASMEKIALEGEKAAQKTERLGQAFQGLIGLAGLLGGAVGAALGGVAQIASNANTEFAGVAAKQRDYNKAIEAGTIVKGSDADKSAKAAISQAKLTAGVNAGAAAAGLLGGAMQKSSNATVAQAGAALQAGGAGAKMGAAFGPVGAIVGGVVGGIVGFIGAGKRMRAEVTKMYDDFVKAAGGMDELKKSAAEAGVSLDEVMKNKGTKNVAAMKKAIEEAKAKMEAFDSLLQKTGTKTMKELEIKASQAGISLKKMLDAKSAEDYKKAVEDIGKQFDTWQLANDKLNAAMEKYGISIEQLGPKMRQQKLDEQAAGLYEDWMLLLGAGVDMTVLIEKFGPTYNEAGKIVADSTGKLMVGPMNEYVNTAIRAGATIPEAMKPAMQALFDQGKLVHENGEAYTQAEFDAIKYGKTQEEMFNSLLEKITELVNALLGIPDVENTVTTTHRTRYEGEGGGGGGGRRNEGDDVPMAVGGIITKPTRILAGEAGREAIIPLDQFGGMGGGGLTADEHRAAIQQQTRELSKVFRDAVLQTRS